MRLLWDSPEDGQSALAVAMTLVLAALGSLAAAQTVEVLPLNTAEDLDLSGNIIYAVNFGNNGYPKFGDFVFSQDQDYPQLTFTFSEEGQTSTWQGLPPNTGNPDLDMLLHGVIWLYAEPSSTTSIRAGGLAVGMQYQLQLIFYTDQSRPMDIVVEDDTLMVGYNPFVTQGSVQGKGGSILKYVFRAGDATLDIRLIAYSQASAISGLVLTQVSSSPFADYGSGTTTELVSGKGTWQVNGGQGPWTWSQSTGSPLLSPSVSGVLDLHATAGADVSGDLVATLPIAGTLTLAAHDEKNKDVIIGTMALSGTGVNVIDLNASRVMVDEGCGMFLAPFRAPAPRVTMTLEVATGVFAYINPASDWELSFAGSYAAPLMKGVPLQDNIMAALSGQVAMIGGVGEFELTGQYEGDESKRPQRFCEYGTGIGLRFGAGGALWDQDWSGGPWDWYECPAGANAAFLGNNVSGELETTTAGAPTIDENLVLSFDFGGHMTLVSHNEALRDGTDGQILGDVDGVFVADLNAEHATIDADGNIVIAFGVSVHDAPDALITVTEATGVYADIRQAGQWAWYVNGVLSVARLPDLSIQDNIMAALQNNDLILHAEEEFVLTGWYYRDSDGR